MSSDSGKDNASVADSSVTDGKHEVGALEDPESTSYKGNEVYYRSNSGEPRQCHDKLGGSIAQTNEKFDSTRYFIIKSFNHENIQLSIERGIWATQVMNEPILEEAFHNSGKVILIFSVNMSGFFQGYAEMMSSVGWRRDDVWSQDGVRNNPWGRSFKVKWLRLNDLPFQKTLHLRNPLNDNKPVKISRDCQELPQDIGEALCALLDEGAVDEDIRRDDIHQKRTFMDSPCSSRNDDYNGYSGYMPWPQMPMPLSSTAYQQQAEATRFNFGYQRSALPENFSTTADAPVISNPKHPRLDRNPSKIKSDRQISPTYDMWGLPADSPLASTLTADDILEMSYEEYLEFHRRSTKQLSTPAMEPSRTPKGTPKDDDSKSSSGTEPRRSHKRPHHSSAK